VQEEFPQVAEKREFSKLCAICEENGNDFGGRADITRRSSRLRMMVPSRQRPKNRRFRAGTLDASSAGLWTIANCVF
jgi:hypothetical protein